jgi:hypothetical protein
MFSNRTVRKSIVTLAAGVCAGFFATTLPASAESPVLNAPPPGGSVLVTPPSKRLILHDVRVQGSDLSIAPASRPVLDYAVRMLQEYPDTVVYISGQGDNGSVRREAEAVTRYLSQRGISPNRLVLSNPARSQVADQRNPSGADADVVVLNFTTPAS